MHCHSKISEDDKYLSNYLRDIHKFPILEDGEEFQLARDWLKNKNKKSLEKLINGHLRLVVKIASGYSGYGLPIKDLISEGSVGILQAINHYDPDMGYKFSTYSSWWIKSKIQEYIFNSCALIKLTSSKANRKLFFGLRKLKSLLGIEKISEENIDEISKKLNEANSNICKKQIIEADMHLRKGNHISINEKINNDDDSFTWENLIVDNRATAEEITLAEEEMQFRKKIFHEALEIISEREKNIVIWNRLTEPPLTLSKIGEKLNISKERVRQLEERAFLKIKEYIKKRIEAINL